MDLDGSGIREARKLVAWQCRCAVLYYAGEPVLAATDLGDSAQRVIAHVDRREAAVGQHFAAMVGARVDADLADADARAPVRGERLREGLHERTEFLRRRVVMADLANLGADGDGEVRRLELADQAREVCGQLGVQT